MAAVLQSLTDPAVDRYRARFAETRAGLPGAAHGWVTALRDEAIAIFANNGVPTRRVESWKYTDLRPVLRADFAPASRRGTVGQEDIAPFLIEDAAVAVFVDGSFAADLSRLAGLPNGAKLLSLAEALEAGDRTAAARIGSMAANNAPGFAALNTALMQDGAIVRIADGTEVSTPIQLLFVTTDGFAGDAHLRNLVVLGANSRATLVRSHVALGAATGFCEVVTEVDVGPGAALRNATLQSESASAFHIALTAARIGRDATLDSFALSAGARLARNEIRVRLDGPGGDCTLNGIALVRGRQHADNTTDIDHAMPHCHSAQLYKNVLDERGRSVFQGRIHVAPDAQKTDAHQMNRNLLLSRDAQADSKPELIIHADDVKCSHGATVGDLDREALFYLESRGIDEKTARNLLVQGFAAEMLDAITDEAVRGHFETALNRWLDGMSTAQEAAA